MNNHTYIPINYRRPPQSREPNSHRQIRTHCQTMLCMTYRHTDQMNYRTDNAPQEKRQNRTFPSEQKSCSKHQLDISSADSPSDGDKINNQKKHADRKHSDHVILPGMQIKQCCRNPRNKINRLIPSAISIVRKSRTLKTIRADVRRQYTTLT